MRKKRGEAANPSISPFSGACLSIPTWGCCNHQQKVAWSIFFPGWKQQRSAKVDSHSEAERCSWGLEQLLKVHIQSSQPNRPSQWYYPGNPCRPDDLGALLWFIDSQSFWQVTCTRWSVTCLLCAFREHGWRVGNSVRRLCVVGPCPRRGMTQNNPHNWRFASLL